MLNLSLFFVLVFFSVLLVLSTPRLRKRELVYVLLVHLYALIVVLILFLLVSGVGCGLFVLFYSLVAI